MNWRSYKSKVIVVTSAIAALLIVAQLWLIATSGMAGSLDTSKINGYFVFANDRHVTVYSLDQKKTYTHSHAVLDVTDALVSSNRPTDGVLLLSRSEISGLLKVLKNGSSINVTPIDTRGNLEQSNITYWRRDGANLYSVTQGRDRRSASILRLNLEKGRIDTIDIPLQRKASQDEWTSAPSVFSDEKVVFNVPVEKGSQLVVLADMPSRTSRILATGMTPELSPDGSLVAFSSGLDVNIMNIESGEAVSHTVWRPQTLRDLPGYLAGIYPHVITRIQWLGDNRYIACAATEPKSWNSTMVVVDTSTGKTSRIPGSARPNKLAWTAGR